MNLLESLRVAMRGLVSNKMRTALTMLGIIIGVGVVIIVVAIGEGASQRVQEQVNALGTNQLSIWPGTSRIRINAVTLQGASGSANAGNAASPSPTGQSSASRLTLDDAKMIAKNFPKTVDAVAPQVRGNVQIRLGNKDSSTNLTGSTTDYPYVNSAEGARRRFFTAGEQDASR